MRRFVQYWSNEIFEYNLSLPDSKRGNPDIGHTSGNRFRKLQVERGDYVYNITNRNGTLTLGGRIEVEKIVDQREAERIMGTTDLWEASDHVIGSMMNPWDGVDLSRAQAKNIRCINAAGHEVPLVILSDGRVDKQTLRGVREITEATGQLFDSVLNLQGPSEMVVSDIDDSGTDEGDPLVRTHLSRERDRALRQRKIRSVLKAGGSLECEACGFNFGQTYGRRGEGFIEVHHRRPLHDSGPVKTRLADLVLLCSNCHRMVHHGLPWLTIAELQHQLGGSPDTRTDRT